MLTHRTRLTRIPKRTTLGLISLAMRVGAIRLVFTVGTVLSEVSGRPTPVPRVHRDVATSQGAVRGYLAPDPPHFAYFGLPYARPPTRRDRFKAPKPPPEWDGIFEAIHKIKCPQPNADGEENCLVVNVFAPELSSSLPVLVFVHDGDFQNGWGAYQPPTMFLKEGFVIVTFNYRLGALGFLCLSISDAPGNAGLKDHIAALYWVRRNIAQFGGNPHDVTVYGTGAGAASVQLVLLSGLAKGLLHRVVLESGSVLSPSSLTYDPISTAYDSATSLGYEGTDDPDELYTFYQETSAKNLADMPEMFLPCVDNMSDYVHSLIDFDPIQKLKEGHFHNVPMLITYTHKDKTSILGKDTQRFEDPPDNFEYLLPNNLEFDNHKVKQRVGEIVKQFYFNEDFTRGNMVQSYADYIHDILTEYPIMKMAMLFAAKNTYSVYVMKFNVQKESETSEESATTSFDSLLDYLYRDTVQTDDDIEEKLMVLWRNFMKLGDPTPLTTTLIPLIWQPVPSNKEAIIDLSEVPTLQFDTNLKMSVPSNNQRLLFWDNIYSRFYKPHMLEQEQSEDLDDND